jgi:outer membrane beta-barrel protein
MRHDPHHSSIHHAHAVRALLLATTIATCATPALSQTAPEPAVPLASDRDSTQSVEGTAVPMPAVSDLAAAPNPSPVSSSKKVRLIGKPQNVVRSGPGSGFAIVGVYPKDATYTVIAKTDEWYNIRLSETESGWIHASLCKELDDLSGLKYQPNPRLYSRTGSYTLAGYSGAYAYDRKSNSLVLGGRLGYYVFDRLRAEAGVSWTHVRRPAEIVESLFGLSLEAEDFHMLFYQMDAVWELLPGRQMVPFVGAGVGSTIMLGRSEPSLNFGAGTMLFVSKRTAMRWEVREYRFDSGPGAARITNNNVEFTLSSEFLF